MTGEAEYTPSPEGRRALQLGKAEGQEAIARVAPMLLAMNQEERTLFFANFFGVSLGHMKAAIGREGARGVIDALKTLADKADPGEVPRR